MRFNIGKFDFITILLYFVLVFFGWMNIYSASLSESATDFFDFSYTHSKQLVWIGLSIVIILFTLALDSKFFERFSSLIYLFSLLSLVGLFFLERIYPDKPAGTVSGVWDCNRQNLPKPLLRWR